jgi:polyisoprenoid-binding protein YceI
MKPPLRTDDERNFPVNRPAFLRHFLALAALAFAGGAGAVEYTQMQAEKSALSFVSRQMNVPTDGRFKRFSAKVAFDPAQPAKGSIDFEIDMASVDLGSSEADDEAKGKDWFNVKSFPTARFVSTAIRPAGPNKYEVAGKLTIKGRTREVVAPVSFRPDGAAGVFEGGLTIRRADYAIGEGMWSTFDTVANEVQIKFRLLAQAKK